MLRTLSDFGAAVRGAIGELQMRGHAVSSEMSGLYRIDGGPELTTGQFLQIAGEMIAAHGAVK